MTNEHDASGRRKDPDEYTGMDTSMDTLRKALAAIARDHRSSRDPRSGNRGLRGRILGAARDRAWRELGRRLETLHRLCLALSRQETSHDDPRHTDSQRVDSPPPGTPRPDSTRPAAPNDRDAERADPSRAHARRPDGVRAAWTDAAAAAHALSRRLRGLGVDVDLSAIPQELPACLDNAQRTLERIPALDTTRSRSDPGSDATCGTGHGTGYGTGYGTGHATSHGIGHGTGHTAGYDAGDDVLIYQPSAAPSFLDSLAPR